MNKFTQSDDYRREELILNIRRCYISWSGANGIYHRSDFVLCAPYGIVVSHRIIHSSFVRLLTCPFRVSCINGTSTLSVVHWYLNPHFSCTRFERLLPS